MGDHRADIKIDFTFHGKTYKYDAWINWVPESEYWSIDPRVVDFFRECYDDGIERYNEIVYASEKEEREKAERKRDLAELQRLKEKY